MGLFDSFKIKELELQNEALQIQLSVALSRIEQNKEDATDFFHFDFEAMNAFSIERIQEKKCSKTVIGYRIQGVGGFTVCEWNFDCNEQDHLVLVSKFKAYMNKRVVKVELTK
jgi:hypothetical protein